MEDPARSVGTEGSVADPPRIGPYRIVKELGRGGMGTVYLCADTAVGDRLVALKVVHDPRAGGAELIERFLQLRETAFRDPHSYFAKYAHLTDDEALEESHRIWDTINGPNLEQNILPTRGRATLVLRKAADHSIRWVRLRKL